MGYENVEDIITPITKDIRNQTIAFTDAYQNQSQYQLICNDVIKGLRSIPDESVKLVTYPILTEIGHFGNTTLTCLKPDF